LNPSRFYHIGTFSEYLYFFSEDPPFAHEVITQNVLNVFSEPDAFADPSYTLLNCEVGGAVSIGTGTTVEFYAIGDRVKIGSQCLVSGVSLPDGANIPYDTFIQTWGLPNSNGVSEAFVAHVLSTKDDIKKESRISGTWLGVPIVETCAKLGIDVSTVSTEDEKPPNIWEAKLFPTGSTQLEATARALELAKAALGQDVDTSWLVGMQRHSLASSLRLSDARMQGQIRRDLSENILQRRQTTTITHPNGTVATSNASVL
jgi:hypothetical protein